MTPVPRVLSVSVELINPQQESQKSGNRKNRKGNNGKRWVENNLSDSVTYFLFFGNVNNIVSIVNERHKWSSTVVSKCCSLSVLKKRFYFTILRLIKTNICLSKISLNILPKMERTSIRTGNESIWRESKNSCVTLLFFDSLSYSL